MAILKIILVTFVTLNIFLVSRTDAHRMKHNESLLQNEALSQEPCENGQRYVDKGLCIDDGYRTDRPPTNGIVPIATRVDKMDILEIKEKDKTIEIQFRISRIWQDGRMTMHKTLHEDGPPQAWFIYYDKILLPIWFPKGIKGENVRRMKELYDPYIYTWISRGENSPFPNATYVKWYNEVQLSLFCDFTFTYFPLDTQSCQFVETNEYGRQLQLLLFPDNENELLTISEKDGFKVEISFVQGDDWGSNNLSYCGFNLTLKRIYSSYVFQYYLPVSAIVFLSQISFIIPPSSIPGRIGFLATLFLTLMNICINYMVSTMN